MEDLIKELCRKVSYLENTLVAALQSLSPYFQSEELRRASSEALKETKEYRDEFRLYVGFLKRKADEAVHEALETVRKSPELDLIQAVAEMKYIGNRMRSIEEMMERMMTEGLRKKVDIGIVALADERPSRVPRQRGRQKKLRS